MADLRSGRVAENVEGAEAAVGRLEGVLAYPASVAVAVEVVLRAYLSVHVGEADAWDLLGLGLLSAEAGGKNPLCQESAETKRDELLFDLHNGY